MAENEQKNESEEQQIKEEAPPKKPFPIKPIIIGFLGLVFLGGVFFLFKSGMLKGSESDASLLPTAQSSKPDIGPIYSLDTFIVNLVGAQGKSYLKAKLDLELSDERLKEEIDKRLPQFRDTILIQLSSKNSDGIRTLEGKYQLREELISLLNQYLRSGKIVNIYFTDFIVQ